ncbi:oligopeptide transporter OPT family protein, partial [Trifolium medium]|nr:oligopeptide transporter OPT family protein [Trifolium medium]
AGFLGSPLAYPGFAIINMLVGFVLYIYVVIPISYWSNFYDAKKFPLISSHTFDSTGAIYNVSRILNDATFNIDMDAYNNYSKLYLSITFAIDYGLCFATLTATISHVFLFHGKTINQMWRKTTAALKEQAGDVHTRIMKRNYEQVPEWWSISILFLMTIMALICCEGFDKQLQLPWWGVLLSLTTNQQAGLNVITELIIGYLYPGKPLANVAFKTYGYISM